MNSHRRGVLAKVFQALGIAAVMVGLVQGIYGDMWGELYLWLCGMAVFYVGWLIERKTGP